MKKSKQLVPQFQIGQVYQGKLLKIQTSKQDKAEINNALKVLTNPINTAIFKLQYADNLVILEKTEGTNKMFKNQENKNVNSGVLVKFPKKQDPRIDLPTIGLNT